MKKKPQVQYQNQLFYVLSAFLAAIALVEGVFLFDPILRNHFSHQVNVEKSPGELVDLAMAVPGAIVLSPHRDLVEMGIVPITAVSEECSINIYVDSPSIAVKTRKHWCIWGLGMGGWHSAYANCFGTGVTPVLSQFSDFNSYNGYQSAFDSFTKCVAEGNAVKPQS